VSILTRVHRLYHRTVMGSVLDSARKYDPLPDIPALHVYLARLDAREAKQRACAA
jgi:hypothetical protein